MSRIHPGLLALLGSVVVVVGLGGLLYFMQPDDNPNPTGKPLKVLCAAGIQKPMRAIAEEYEKESGQKIELHFSGSNDLLAKLKLKNDGELYLSADEQYIREAKAEGIVAESIPLATMRAVVLAGPGNPKQIEHFDDLLRKDVRVAIARPESAAIGRVTQDVLAAQDLWDKLDENLTAKTGTVNESANSVKTNGADAAIIWDAVAHNFPDFTVIRMPELSGITGGVEIGVLTNTEIPAAALQFARYVNAPEKGQKHFRELGFPEVAEGDPWAEKPELVVYHGSMLRPAIEKTLEEFKRREGIEITTKSDGCGILVDAMKLGARPDLYFSCDVSFMNMVRDSEHNLDLFQQDTVVTGNQLVIAVPKGNPKNIQALKDLAEPGLRIGVGHETKCAMGAITDQTLRQVFAQQDTMFGRIQKNIVVKKPNGDALTNDMQLDNPALDAAIVYRSNLAECEDKLDGIPVTGIACAMPSQPVAIGKETKYPRLMARLMDTLTSEKSRERFEAVGFTWQLGGEE